MYTLNNIKAKTVKRFVNGSFVLIGLFTVLSYGFAALVLLNGVEKLGGGGGDVCGGILLGVLVVLPVLLFFTFPCFAKRYYNKLCEVTCVSNGDTLISSRCLKNKIIWVGGEQTNICCERIALESHGITITKVSTTAGALELLEKDDKYIAVVFDMGSNGNGGTIESLLSKIREKNPTIPVFTLNKY